jgi:hypothetical protein
MAYLLSVYPLIAYLLAAIPVCQMDIMIKRQMKGAVAIVA